MRKIAIIGGGQAGLLLAFSLLENKYDVTYRFINEKVILGLTHYHL